MTTIILSITVMFISIIGLVLLSENVRQFVEVNIERKLNEKDNSSPRANHEEAVERSFDAMALIGAFITGFGLPILLILLETCL